MSSYDVIVIGSGAGGGTLVHRLAPSGKRILLLERGDWLPREPQNWSAADVFVDNRSFIVLVLAVTVVCGLLIAYLAKSGMGVTLRAIRESERSTEAAGRNVVYTKTVVFALASGFAGLAGGLYATLVGLISPMDFDMHRSILVIAFLLVGGVGNMRGAALGAVVLLTVPEMVARIDAIPSQYLGPVEQIIYGAIIVVFVWLRPVGLLPERPVVYMRPRSALQRVLGDRVAGWIRPDRKGVAAGATAQ